MRQSLVTAAFAALSGHAVAFPQYDRDLQQRQAPNPWQAPGPGDLRAPCPGLNTLANHGYINHNGSDITAQALQQGFLDAFGFSFEVTQAGATNAINQCSSMTGTTCTAFNLDQMNAPHEIEHDGSLTRQDAEMIGVANPSNSIFSAEIWGATRDDLYGSCNTHADTVLSGNVLRERNQQSTTADPPGWFVLNAGGEQAEHGFILTTMNDPTVGTIDAPQARLDWMDFWFRNERLPTELGWVKPATPISGPQHDNIASLVANAPTTTNGCPTSTSSSSSSSSSTSTSSSSSSTSTTTTTSPPGGASSGSPSSSGNSGAPYPVYNSTVPIIGTVTTPTSTTTSTTTSTITTKGSTYTATSTITSTAVAASTTTIAASATSSAKAQASAIAGPQPAVPNAYKDTLAPVQWVNFKVQIDTYVYHIQSLCTTIIGAYIYVGSFSSSTGGGVPQQGPPGLPGGPGTSGQPGAPGAPSYPSCPCTC